MINHTIDVMYCMKGFADHVSYEILRPFHLHLSIHQHSIWHLFQISATALQIFHQFFFALNKITTRLKPVNQVGQLPTLPFANTCKAWSFVGNEESLMFSTDSRPSFCLMTWYKIQLLKHISRKTCDDYITSSFTNGRRFPTTSLFQGYCD